MKINFYIFSLILADKELESVINRDLILDIKPFEKRFANAVETKDLRFLDKSGDIKAIEKEGDTTFDKKVIKAVDLKDLKVTDDEKIRSIEQVSFLPIEKRVIKAVDAKDINSIEKLNDKTIEKLIIKPIDDRIVKPIDIKQIDGLDEEPVMIIVTRDKCGYSIAMREFLRTHHVKFKDINVSKVGRGVLKEMNLEGLKFPMVHFKGKYIGGHDDTIINKDVLNYIKQIEEKKGLKSGKHGEDADESSLDLQN